MTKSVFDVKNLTSSPLNILSKI